MSTITAGLALALAGTLALTGTGPDAETTLVEGTTSTARLEVPYPGHTTSFDVTARPTSSDPVELALVVEGAGPLATGPDALTLTLADATGTVLAEGTAAALSASPIALGSLHEEPVTLHGTAALPATAGDDVQGAGLTLTLRLIATQDGPGLAPGPVAVTGDLAVTGPQLVAAALAAVLVGMGALLLAARRRTRSEEES
ncbi:hypothetical protein [Cellulomonas hominis]|uniref:hypothetical protein n=1 Tax=Cellulomonas hominis TaxID=156981 RepID=UPI001B8DDB4D|nr:hypothetical protein [Cellulomonas hominis]VTR76310.1 hypothetical protein CHMI_01067 [Cellulomonas hominis]